MYPLPLEYNESYFVGVLPLIAIGLMVITLSLHIFISLREMMIEKLVPRWLYKIIRMIWLFYFVPTPYQNEVIEAIKNVSIARYATIVDNNVIHTNIYNYIKFEVWYNDYSGEKLGYDELKTGIIYRLDGLLATNSHMSPAEFQASLRPLTLYVNPAENRLRTYYNVDIHNENDPEEDNDNEDDSDNKDENNFVITPPKPKIPIEEAKEGEPYCVVCRVNKPDCALAPCFHQNYCGECCPLIKECSICREPIISYGKVYT